jgi:hypothetical protein
MLASHPFGFRLHRQVLVHTLLRWVLDLAFAKRQSRKLHGDVLGDLSAELNRLSVDGDIAHGKALARRHFEDGAHRHPRGAADDLEIRLGVVPVRGDKPGRVDAGHIQADRILQRNLVPAPRKGIHVIANGGVAGAAGLSKFRALD